jgi:hypothetical protein
MEGGIYMTSGTKKALVVTGGVCTIAAGYAAYKESKKWSLGSLANVVGGAVVIIAAIF